MRKTNLFSLTCGLVLSALATMVVADEQGEFVLHGHNDHPIGADVTGDCLINELDVIEVLVHWGETGGAADVDQSGFVGIGDLLAVLLNWGTCD